MTKKTPLYQVEDGWFEIVSGKKFFFENPTVDMIEPEDVAYSLARQCRYNGHTKRWYSVCEHTCIMSDWVMEQPWATPRDGLTALHHDDAEYAIGDMIRPVKDKVPQFKVIEEGIDQVIARRFGTIWPFPGWLKEADTRILVDERATVMNPSDNRWGTDDMEPLGVKFMPIRGRFFWLMERAWLKRHRRLIAKMLSQAKMLS